MKIKSIITGISGQDGAYLSKLLLEKGHEVYGFTRRHENSKLWRLTYLEISDQVELVDCDLADLSQVISLIKEIQPDEIYNLAAQSSVSLSFKQPIGTFNFNITSVVNLLDSIRLVKPNTRFYQASTSEMYGDSPQLPISENTVLNPKSPYGISKAASHWITRNYREAYGIHASCGILFNHESYLRSNNFFVKKVIREGILISKGLQDLLRVGNVEVRRDFGSAPNYVKAMYEMLQQSIPDDYIICSGKSIMLSDIISYVFQYLQIEPNRWLVDKNLYRPTDIYEIYGDSSKARSVLNWHYEIDFKEILKDLIDEEIRNWTNEKN